MEAPPLKKQNRPLQYRRGRFCSSAKGEGRSLLRGWRRPGGDSSGAGDGSIIKEVGARVPSKDGEFHMWSLSESLMEKERVDSY
ncbi:hypothetical protein QYF36_016167 [Acer negundo]|nr:hypothetical protein QYF36_016167 [Acer negundo]